MENKLFRQESIDRISSPEELHDYMKVTSPKIWMILGAIVLLLAGFVVYASTANMESTMKITVDVMNYERDPEFVEPGQSQYVTFISAELPFSKKDMVSAGMPVRIVNERAKIEWISYGEGEARSAGCGRGRTSANGGTR